MDVLTSTKQRFLRGFELEQSTVQSSRLYLARHAILHTTSAILKGTGQSRLIQPQLQLSTTNGETLLFMNRLPPTYKTAIGFPGEPVAPMIGTGTKM